MDHLADQLSGVGALSEPVRRALYGYVAHQPGAVSREQAAAAVEVPLHTAKFHLDRLVAAGLLEVEFRRLSGRTGPGAGRPSKLYRRSARQWSVSLPERRYELAGEVLAAAVERALSTGEPVAATVPGVARETGLRIGTAHHPGDAAAGEDPLEVSARVLGCHGYEPVVTEDEVRLTNCPFDRLASDHTDLVCGLNRDLVGGVVDALSAGLTSRLAPEQGFCCVRVSRRP